MKKRNVGKQILSVMLVIAMVLTLMPMSSYAAVGDLSNVSTGLTGDIDTTDTISLPIKILDYNDLDFSSFAEFRRIFKQQLLQDIAIYGAVFLMIATIYIVIQRSFLASKNKYWQTRFVLLKQIGMEDDQYFKMAFKEECKSYLWLFLGLIPGWYLSACALFEIYGTLEGESSVVWYFLFNRIDHKIYIGMALLLYLVVVAGSANVIRKCIRENTKTKQNQPENGK